MEKVVIDRTTRRVFDSNATVIMLAGPVGVGKTGTLLLKILKFVMEHVPVFDGARRARFLVTRKTYGELEISTRRVIAEWVGDAIESHGKAPVTLTFGVRNPDSTLSEIEMDLISLETKEECDTKLKGAPYTGGWVNEGQLHDDPQVATAVYERLGRYPQKETGYRGEKLLMIDYNQPALGHWIHKWETNPPGSQAVAIEGAPSAAGDFKVEFFRWPAPFIWRENTDDEDAGPILEAVNPEADYIEKQPAGIKYWLGLAALNADDPDYIMTQILGEYGEPAGGKAVYRRAWKEAAHTAPGLAVFVAGEKLLAGCDTSGMHPAIVFARQTSRGLVILASLSPKEVGFYEFVHDILLPFCVANRLDPRKITIACDPNNAKFANDRSNPLRELREARFDAVIAPTNAVSDRISSVRYFLARNRIRVHLEGNDLLLQGFRSSYTWAKSEHASLRKPNKKAAAADVHDALQYLASHARQGAREVVDNRPHHVTQSLTVDPLLA